MALGQHELQELAVGLYDRGQDMPSDRRIFDIGIPNKFLKSGIWSPYLVNFRPVLSIDERSKSTINQQLRTKNLLLEAISDQVEIVTKNPDFHTPDFFHIFGLPEAGTPLASAVSAAGDYSLLWERVISKGEYGSHQDLEGVYFDGQNVVQVDDVVTKGGTKQEGKEFLTGYGLNVTGVAVGFDREQGGREAVEASGMRFGAALGARAVFAYLREDNRIKNFEYEYLLHYTLNPAPLEQPADFPWKTT